MFEVDWPEHWKIAKLGDKAELKNGINFKKEQKGQGILTVDVLNMYSDGIYLDSTNLYRVDCKIRDRDLLRANDILFVRSSLKQEGVAWASLFGGHEVPMTFCGFLIRARLTTSEINHEFLTHYFRTDFARRFLVSKSARLAITNISQATLSSCPIPLPPLPEQRAIAHVLQTIQEAKAARQRELALERERKAALMDYLFSYGTKDEPRKQTEIGEIPESWEVVKFEEVAIFTKKPKELRYSEYHEIPFVPMELIPIAKPFSAELIPKTNDELSSGTYFEPGDILLAKITPSFENGKQCIIDELPTPFGIATTEVIPTREVVGVSNKFYLFYYLLLSEVRTLLAGKMQGTTGRQRLSKQTLSSLEIPLPPLPEQGAIAKVFQAIDEKTATLEQEVVHLEELFHAMLDELMTGKRSAVSLIDSEISN